MRFDDLRTCARAATFAETVVSTAGVMYQNLLSLTAPDVSTPRKFLEACVGYFAWAESEPLQEEALFHYKGAVVRATQDKVRALSKRGLATFLGMSLSQLNAVMARKHYDHVTELVEQTIYAQKFEAAAAGLLQASIITRELGLVDKVDTTSQGQHVAAPPETMTAEQLKQELELRGLPSNLFS